MERPDLTNNHCERERHVGNMKEIPAGLIQVNQRPPGIGNPCRRRTVLDYPSYGRMNYLPERTGRTLYK